MIHNSLEKDVWCYEGWLGRNQVQVLDVRILAVHRKKFTHLLAEFCNLSGSEYEKPLYLKGFDFHKAGEQGLCLDEPRTWLGRVQKIIPYYDAESEWCRRYVECWNRR